MKICGLITEYHPFHNGHLYHVQEAKKISGADYCIAVMSGNYVQRGTPAMIDKYTRTRMALAAGVDVVIELPSFVSSMSAEYFAYGGVSLLDSLSCVDSLCFGSECGDLTLLQTISKVLLEEPTTYKEKLREVLKTGVPFPKARETAIFQYLSAIGNTSLEGIANTLSSPNNILSIEYLKSIEKRHCSITPYTITRAGNHYHDTEIPTPSASEIGSCPTCSATALRTFLTKLQNADAEKKQTEYESLLTTYIPSTSLTYLSEYMENNRLLGSNDFSEYLLHALWEHYSQGYTAFADVTKELSDRIQNTLFQFTSYDQYCDLLKTKDMTYSRISRCLLHILLHITKEEVEARKQASEPIPYCRLLGFRKEAKEVLSMIDTHSRIPIISKLADYRNILPSPTCLILEEEIRRDHLYNSISALRNGYNTRNEFTMPMIVM